MFNYFCCPRRCAYTILEGFYYIYRYICTAVHSTLFPDPNTYSTQYIITGSKHLQYTVHYYRIQTLTVHSILIPGPNIYSTLLVFGTTHV